MSKGYHVPTVRVSTGFTGSRKGYKAIGSCWSNEAAKDGINQLFISPVIDDSLRVLDVLLHEICHAVVGVKEGHNKVFKRCAQAVGLTGKMTQTVASPELTTRLQSIVKDIGEYPHAELMPSLSGTKKQGTRLLKAECTSCGYTIRVTKQWVSLGLPTCLCGTEFTMDIKEIIK
jgi:hypothetical protein